MLRKRFESLTKSPDPQDHEHRQEREESKVPFFKSPFHAQPVVPDSNPSMATRSMSGLSEKTDWKSSESSEPYELQVHVADEVAWIDLLLELAMTTAFANLADNTPIDSGDNVASYIAFFALVWWIWASQVAYNMRFRQADWFHRSCAFLQLLVFSGMAAFTNNFDITNGLSNDAIDQQQIANLSIGLGSTSSQLTAEGFRNARLPNLNASGISMVMGLSRLLMLAQYLLAFHHARHYRRTALIVQISAIVTSALFYFITFGILDGSDPGEGVNVAKIILWYSAIVIEFVAHFVANFLPGHVSYEAEAVLARSSTLFIVVLGIGLDKITNQFRFIVGTLGFGAGSVAVSFSIAVILIGIFTLYFDTSGKVRGGNHRALIFFFAHFPFMAAVIILLRGIASIFSFVNFSNAVTIILIDFDQIFAALGGVGPVTPASLPDVVGPFDKLGVSLEDTLNQLSAINSSQGLSVMDKYLGFFQVWTGVLLIVLDEFDAMPDPGSALTLRIEQFQSANSSTVVNPNEFFELIYDVVAEELTPAIWFMGTAGATIIMLGVLMLIRNWPRDRWEWGAVLSRLLSGAFVALLSLFDIHSGRPVESISINFNTGEASSKQSDSLIWAFAQSAWMLPSLAILLVMLNVVNVIMDYLARRAYRNHDRKNSTNSGPNLSMPIFTAVPTSSPPTFCRSLPPIPDDPSYSDTHPFDPYLSFPMPYDPQRSSD